MYQDKILLLEKTRAFYLIEPLSTICLLKILAFIKSIEEDVKKGVNITAIDYGMNQCR